MFLCQLHALHTLVAAPTLPWFGWLWDLCFLYRSASFAYKPWPLLLARSEVTTFLYHHSLFKHSSSWLTSLLAKRLLPYAISGGSCSPSPSVLETHRRFSGCKCYTATCPFAGYVCFTSSSLPSPAAWTRHHLATRVWPAPCELCSHAWYTPGSLLAVSIVPKWKSSWG